MQVDAIQKQVNTQSINNKNALESLISKLDLSKSVHMDYRAYKFDIILRGEKSIPFENRI